MARIHEPDPLDLVMFATDRAMRRVGMPGSDLHVHLRLVGRLDEAGFLRALAVVRRRHPAITARLQWSALTGRPCWRLPDDPPAAEHALHVHPLDPATPEQLHAETEAMLGSRIDPVNTPPLQFHLFRGPPGGDVLVMRWTHTLMDGRGGFLILEEIDREYQRHTEDQMPGCGDEATRSVPSSPMESCLPGGGHLAETPAPHDRSSSASRSPKPIPAPLPIGRFPCGAGILACIRRRLEACTTASETPQPDTAMEQASRVYASPCPALNVFSSSRSLRPSVKAAPGHLRYSVLRFAGEDYWRIRETARRVSPSGRLDTFIRVAALRALGGLPLKGRTRDADYSLQFIHECRESPFRAPVCRNLFITQPGCVPASLIHDGRALAARIDALAEASASPATMARSLARLRTMSKVPTNLLAEILRRRMISGDTLGFSRGLARLPSLPLGIMRAFTRRMPTFCGAELSAADAFRRPRPQPGWVLQTVLRERQFSISAVWLDSKTDSTKHLLEALSTALLDHKW